jgi:hypothetical protein
MCLYLTIHKFQILTYNKVILLQIILLIQLQVTPLPINLKLEIKLNRIVQIQAVEETQLKTKQ